MLPDVRPVKEATQTVTSRRLSPHALHRYEGTLPQRKAVRQGWRLTPPDQSGTSKLCCDPHGEDLPCGGPWGPLSEPLK
jgi:hypothetical protein